MVKQHNIDVHGIIMQFSIIIIQELLSPRNPRNFVVQKMFFAYYQKGEVDLKYNCQYQGPSEMTDEPRHSRLGTLKSPSLLLNGYEFRL